MLRDWPSEWPPERIAAVSKRAAAAYLDASQPVRMALLEGSEPIQPRTIIEVGGTYLVEAVDEPDDWYMGERGSDGVIVCWGKPVWMKTRRTRSITTTRCWSSHNQVSFVGRENFLAWRKQYPAKLDFRIRRITHDGNLWVVENLISYDGGPWNFTVSIVQFRGLSGSTS